MNKVIILPARISKVSDHTELMKSILKSLANVIINGGTAMDYQAAYLDIPPSMENLRNTFVERILRKAREENWQVSQIEEVMTALNQM